MEAKKVDIHERELKIEELNKAEQLLDKLLVAHQEELDPKMWPLMMAKSSIWRNSFIVESESCSGKSSLDFP